MIFVEINISIHAPREGGDDAGIHPPHERSISIHAPREGGDCHDNGIVVQCFNFNPRPPRGGRLINY